MDKPDHVSLRKIRELTAARLENDLKLIVRQYEVEAVTVNTCHDDPPNPFHPALTQWRVVSLALETINYMINELRKKTLEERVTQLEQQLINRNRRVP